MCNLVPRAHDPPWKESWGSGKMQRRTVNSIEFTGGEPDSTWPQPRSQGLRGETVTKTLVKFVLSFQNFGKKIACAVRHNRIAIQLNRFNVNIMVNIKMITQFTALICQRREYRDLSKFCITPLI